MVYKKNIMMYDYKQICGGVKSRYWTYLGHRPLLYYENALASIAYFFLIHIKDNI